MTGHGRVLVVDDQPQVLSMLREVVEHLGYEPSTAASGEQAIAAMATVRPHVVFLDLATLHFEHRNLEIFDHMLKGKR